jgi:uncharacterized protein (DUF305 family)
MKRLFIMAGLCSAILACNNDSTTNSANKDSANNTQSQNVTNDSVSQVIDTSAMAGRTMMGVMTSMMDDMKGIQSTGNPDNDFATLMKSHHLSAVQMSELEVAKGSDPDLKRIAQKAISEQQQEIAELNTFLSGHNAHGGGDAFYKEGMNIMDNMKMDMDHSGSIDKQFAQMMILHHQSAIDMAKAYIKTGAHEEKLKTMANNIISSQQKEIGELQAWLSKNK